MKKILCGALLAVSSTFAMANTPVVDPQFAKIENLIKANNFEQAYKELETLSKAGNGQATYNLGYLTQTGKGTKQDPKKAVELYDNSIMTGRGMGKYCYKQPVRDEAEIFIRHEIERRFPNTQWYLSIR